jgi:hypothetical protein
MRRIRPNLKTNLLGMLVLVALVLAVPFTTAAGNALNAYKKEPGPQRVLVVETEWLDPARNRSIPATVYVPEGPGGPFPVVIFSHGLGGSRRSAEYLGRHWASHGYVSVHVQHKGSDADALKNGGDGPEAMRKVVGDIGNAINRPKDISFAADELAKADREDGNLKGKLDLTQLAVAGHSFGAFTALALAGEVFENPRGGEITFTDPRFLAAIPMSAPVAAPERANPKRAFGGIKIPCLHMTGTKDFSPIGETGVEHRRMPFDFATVADQYLLTLREGDHSVFAGRRAKGTVEKDQIFHDLIRMSSTAFLDAYIRGDAAAKRWLGGGGFAAALGRNGVIEKKDGAKPNP